MTPRDAFLEWGLCALLALCALALVFWFMWAVNKHDRAERAWQQRERAFANCTEDADSTPEDRRFTCREVKQ